MRPTPRRVLLTCLLAVSGLASVGACGADPAPTQPATQALTSVDLDALIDNSLAHDEPWLRAETVRLLGLSPDPSHGAKLRSMLQDRSVLVQNACLESLVAQGSQQAENAVLDTMIRGTSTQKIQLLDLLFQRGTQRLRQEAVQRALRDVDVSVRLSAIRRMTQARVAIPSNEVERFLVDSDSSIRFAAFAHMAATRPTEALDEVLRRLRAADLAQRRTGLEFGAILPAPDLWPLMRSVATRGETNDRVLAWRVLGTMGDPIAEDPLRNMVLTADDEEAARALTALTAIPSERAHAQAGRHRRDPRPAVRRAAFEAMTRLNYPLAEIEAWLEDPDPQIGTLALVQLQERDPGWAASAVGRTLQRAASPATVLASLHRASRDHDIRPLLREALQPLRQLSGSGSPEAASLATRLVLQVVDPLQEMPRIREQDRVAARYALLEHAIATRDARYLPLYEEAMQTDIRLLRTAAAIGLQTLDPAARAPAP